MIWTLTDISQEKGVPVQTLKRVITKNENKLKKFINRGIRNRIEFFDKSGIDLLMQFVIEQTRWNLKKSKSKKIKNIKKISDDFKTVKSNSACNIENVNLDDKNCLNNISVEKKLIKSLADHNNSLKIQNENHKDDKKRLIKQIDELQAKIAELSLERDRILFEVAEWRGIYGKIEDQKALVPYTVNSKESFFAKLKSKITQALDLK
jgi:hypothetical protein